MTSPCPSHAGKTHPHRRHPLAAGDARGHRRPSGGSSRPCTLACGCAHGPSTSFRPIRSWSRTSRRATARSSSTKVAWPDATLSAASTRQHGGIRLRLVCQGLGELLVPRGRDDVPGPHAGHGRHRSRLSRVQGIDWTAIGPPVTPGDRPHRPDDPHVPRFADRHRTPPTPTQPAPDVARRALPHRASSLAWPRRRSTDPATTRCALRIWRHVSGVGGHRFCPLVAMYDCPLMATRPLRVIGARGSRWWHTGTSGSGFNRRRASRRPFFQSCPPGGGRTSAPIVSGGELTPERR